jgi:hypothetical protein
MKEFSIAEAQAQLDAVCAQALEGEIVRLRRPNGALVELTPVPAVLVVTPLSDEQLAACYEDVEWATFENHCAAAND